MMDSTFEWPKAMEVSRLENNNLRDSAVLKIVMEEASAKEEHGLDSRLAPPNEEVGNIAGVPSRKEWGGPKGFKATDGACTVSSKKHDRYLSYNVILHRGVSRLRMVSRLPRWPTPLPFNPGRQRFLGRAERPAMAEFILAHAFESGLSQDTRNSKGRQACHLLCLIASSTSIIHRTCTIHLPLSCTKFSCLPTLPPATRWLQMPQHRPSITSSNYGSSSKRYPLRKV
jgi:hypothetical protein